MLVLLAFGTAAVCVRLGIWQLDRLDEVRTNNDRIRAGLGAAPVVLDEAPGPGAAYRRATATGSYDPDGEVVLFGRSLNGRSGDHLLTPLRFTDGSAVLVDRGWVPAGERSRAPAGVVRALGFLLPAESVAGVPPAAGRVTAVDPVGIERALSYELAPVYLLLQQQSPSPPGFPTPAALPELSEGPHLGYAIQWFSFAAVALIGGTVLAARDRPVATRTAE